MKITITGKRTPVADEQSMMMSCDHGNGIDCAGTINAYAYGEGTDTGRVRFVTTRFSFDEIDQLKAFADKMRDEYPNIDLSKGPGERTGPY